MKKFKEIKFSEEFKVRLKIEEFHTGYKVMVIAELHGIPERTHQTWVPKDEDERQRVEFKKLSS